MANAEPLLLRAVDDAQAAATARSVSALTVEAAQGLLDARAFFSMADMSVVHASQLPSNLPCEDTWSFGQTPPPPPGAGGKKWGLFGIYGELLLTT